MWVTSKENTGILFSSPTKYYAILRDAFPSFNFGPAWPDRNKKFKWGVFINGINEHQRTEIESFLGLLQRTICIDDSLNQTFALDTHFSLSEEHPGERTLIGDLVYKAKPYNKTFTNEH
jgi:hypothetical protein